MKEPRSILALPPADAVSFNGYHIPEGGLILLMTREEAVGKKFHKLTVIGWRRDPIKHTRLICRCDCGNVKEFAYESIVRKTGQTQSCGCHMLYVSRTQCVIHGQSFSRTHRAWSNMKTRCLNPKGNGYQYYGGRGILVCERWKDFMNFFADMGTCPPGYSLERINVNGHYEAGNCKWIPLNQQNDNRRKTVWITFEGETKTLKEWCKIKGLPKGTIYERFKRGVATERLFVPLYSGWLRRTPKN